MLRCGASRDLGGTSLLTIEKRGLSGLLTAHEPNTSESSCGTWLSHAGLGEHGGA